MFLIFTGNGKGKTTSALGQALRLVGDGKRVLMVQFIKGPWKSGEDELAKLLAPHFKIMKMGKGFVGILGDTLPLEKHAQAARDALAYAEKEVNSGVWDALILDEVHNAIALKLITVEEVDAVRKRIFAKLEHLIFTGREAPERFIAEADIVTEMREVKHPYAAGISAKKGVEF